MTTEKIPFELMAKRAFALAIHESNYNLSPLESEIEISRGTRGLECEYFADGLVFKGTFYRDEKEMEDATVCISSVEHKGGATQYPFSWHFLYAIRDSYEQLQAIRSIDSQLIE